MQLTLNIEDFSRPVVYQTQRADFVLSIFRFLLRFIHSILDRIKEKLNHDMDVLILVLEGYSPHIEAICPETAAKELKEVKEVLKEFVKANEKLQKINYFDDEIIKEKFSLCLKLIFQTESKLHKAVYINKPVVKTSFELIDGITRMNAQNINKLLSV